MLLSLSVVSGCYVCTPAVHDETLVCVPHFYRHPVCAYILRRYTYVCTAIDDFGAAVFVGLSGLLFLRLRAFLPWLDGFLPRQCRVALSCYHGLSFDGFGSIPFSVASCRWVDGSCVRKTRDLEVACLTGAKATVASWAHKYHGSGAAPTTTLRQLSLSPSLSVLCTSSPPDAKRSSYRATRFPAFF